MIANVTYFGMISEKLQKSSEQLAVELSEKPVNLRVYFEEKYPALKQMSYKIAVDNELIDFVSSESNTSEIALLPPFAGG